MGAHVHIHADHRVHVPERITATPQSVPPEYATGPGGHAVGGRSLCASAVSASGASSPARWPAVGFKTKGPGFQARWRDTQEKRERLCASFLWCPPAVRTHLQLIISFEDGSTCFSHPVSSTRLFIFSSLLQWLKKDIWIISLRGSKSPFWREPKNNALKRPRLPRWNCLYSAASGCSPMLFCGMEWRINEIAMTAVLQCASITARLRLESIICMYLGVSIKGWQRGPQSSIHPKVFGMMEVQLLLLWRRQLERQCVALTCTINFQNILHSASARFLKLF